MSGKLRTAHPKVWAAVSDAKGEVPLRRPLLSYLKLNYGLVVGPEVDCEAACSLLVDKLSTRTSSAVSRWKLLKSALVSDETPSMAPSDASVRRVSTFGLLVSEPKEGIAFPLADPLRFTFTRYNMRGLSVYGVAPRAVKPTLAQLVAHRSAAGGVDNTGNVCVWPCEEAIAYCAVGGEGPAWDITGRVVVELGSGALGLAGLLAAASGRPARVIITDGNEEVRCPLLDACVRVPWWCDVAILCNLCTFLDSLRARHCVARLCIAGICQCWAVC